MLQQTRFASVLRRGVALQLPRHPDDRLHPRPAMALRHSRGWADFEDQPGELLQPARNLRQMPDGDAGDAGSDFGRLSSEPRTPFAHSGRRPCVHRRQIVSNKRAQPTSRACHRGDRFDCWAGVTAGIIKLSAICERHQIYSVASPRRSA